MIYTCCFLKKLSLKMIYTGCFLKKTTTTNDFQKLKPPLKMIYTGCFLKKPSLKMIYTCCFLKKTATTNDFQKLKIQLKNSKKIIRGGSCTRQPHTVLNVFIHFCKKSMLMRPLGIKLSTSSLAHYAHFNCTRSHLCLNGRNIPYIHYRRF
jgi:hypothetical protein